MDRFLSCTLGFVMVGLSLQGRTKQDAAVKSCPPELLSYRKDCYKFFSFKVSWIEAEKICQDYMPGAHLTSVDSFAEMSEIDTYVLDNYNYFENVWIGLYRVGKNKSIPAEKIKWFWSDGSSSRYRYWDEGEPNNKNYRENCVELLHDTGFRYWNDEDCDSKRRFLCKYKL
ncbi:C-type lectin lectoxin-Thr1 [Anolis carolinensis]|uniref:C-type lectin lectoxin-Thr1 n=1 Tax=Anolis carolinensis TaxID=28377 RepID=UPI000462646E|nr:PREDICTED: C-type lectin lectoxin-Thr1-like [Anolis carolinensis]|eukprot:XP_008118344.1 PREDICTED: C-type lectin lectoxin-Thr1-like [Anolis carolinensis]